MQVHTLVFLGKGKQNLTVLSQADRISLKQNPLLSGWQQFRCGTGRCPAFPAHVSAATVQARGWSRCRWVQDPQQGQERLRASPAVKASPRRLCSPRSRTAERGLGCRLSCTVGNRSKPPFLCKRTQIYFNSANTLLPSFNALIYKQEFSRQKDYQDFSRHVRKSSAQTLTKKNWCHILDFHFVLKLEIYFTVVCTSLRNTFSVASRQGNCRILTPLAPM